MDTQTSSNSPLNINQPPKSDSQKTKKLKQGLIILGVFTLIIFIIMLIFASRAFVNQDQLDKKYQEGSSAGAESQKATDDKAREAEKSSDVRTYTAPAFAGGFRVTLPKHWNLAVTPEESGNTISALANPDYVDTKLEKYALRFALREQPIDAAKKNFEQFAKEKDPLKRKTTSSEVDVSGIKSTKYTGQISSKITNGTIILVPIRDKTFTIQTDENDKYLDIYNQIVSQLKLNP